MQFFRRIFLAFLFLGCIAFAQIVPGRYVVELNGGPLGAEVRTRGKAALSSRVAQIHTEQAKAYRRPPERTVCSQPTLHKVLKVYLKIPSKQCHSKDSKHRQLSHYMIVVAVHLQFTPIPPSDHCAPVRVMRWCRQEWGFNPYTRVFETELTKLEAP